jgi:predicted transposase/invertase (TIGR01784 family)
MISRFLNPKNDLVFKRVFGSEANKDILIHFLNDIFAKTTNPIQEVEFIKPIIDPEIRELRVSVVDVLCRDLEGNKFIIEMQCDIDTSFIKRAQYYASKVYCSQKIKNVKYKDLKAVTFLAILEGELFPNTKEYLTHHITLDKNSHAHELKDFSYSFLELKKFNKKPKELKTMIDKWAYFFKNAEDTSKDELPIIIGSDCIIEKAYEALEEYNYTTEEMLYYDQLERNEDVYNNLLTDREAKGKAAGKIEGEKTKAIEIAKKMKNAGITKEAIKKITGVDADL